MLLFCAFVTYLQPKPHCSQCAPATRRPLHELFCTCAVVLQEHIHLTGSPEASDGPSENHGHLRSVVGVPLRPVGAQGLFPQSSMVGHSPHVAMTRGMSQSTLMQRGMSQSTLGCTSDNASTLSSEGDDIDFMLKPPQKQSAITEIAKDGQGTTIGNTFYHSGRPKVEDLFAQAEQAAVAAGCKRIAVLVCGNDSLLQSCLAQTAQTRDSGVHFSAHYEVFGF